MLPTEEPQEELKEEFKLDNDMKAEWAICQIKAKKDEMERMIKVCEGMIEEYRTVMKKEVEKFENGTSYLKGKLMQYFEGCNKQKTKTAETYRLPSGTLKKKFGTITFDRDEDTLIKWLVDNHKDSEFLETQYKLKWNELKKSCNFSGDKLITADGEVVEGVILVQQADKFEIDFK